MTSLKKQAKHISKARRSPIVIIVTAFLSLAIVGTTIAKWQPLRQISRPRLLAVPQPPPPPPPSLAKEYIYAGSKLIATEEPANAAPTVSITDPVNNAIFTAPANISITANASDTDGTISQVEFYQGTILIGTDTAAPYSVTWNNVAAGSYALTAKATDNGGAVTTSAIVNVISNAAPTVSITSPANNTTFTAPANISITASASDTDGTISQVQFYQGTTLIGTATSAPYTITWSNVSAGTYTLTAKATDNRGAVTTSSGITVISNAPPTVSITSPANNSSFTAPANISISANASDTDGTITQVQFYHGTTLIGTDTTTPYSVSWNNVAAGSYALTAKATDNRGAVTTSAIVNVNVVSNVPPTVSITSPPNNTIFTAPANISITASASDSDGTVSQVQFYQGTTLIGTATTAPYTVTWNNVAAGSYDLTAKATDNGGAVTTSSIVNVISNALPAVSITSPANNATFTAPASISITANASDADGSISQVQFFQGATLIGTDTAVPYAVTWSNVAAGSYSLTAKATDNRNAVTTSAAINVTVNPACTPATGLIISEFRLRGPAGSHDEYVELYNSSSQSITVCTADGSSGWALVSSEGITRFVVASGTVIPANANYLATAPGYSLGAYAGSTPGNINYGVEVPDNTGVALFNTSNSANFTLANRFDAVGFNTSNSLYREGVGLSPLGVNAGEYCFLRKLNTGLPQDTGDNVADFTFVATDAGMYGGILAILGAPGPMNLSSPRKVDLPVTLLDPAVAASVAPNRVRDTTAIGPNAAAGTMSIRRTVTNNTTSNITALRFRITDITTLNTPGYVAGGSQSDMRVLNSSDFTATLSNSQQVLVRGTTVQSPPTQSLGGGLHSSVSAGVITLSQPLAPGQSINVQFLLGVQQSGTFRFFFRVEALLQ